MPDILEPAPRADDLVVGRPAAPPARRLLRVRRDRRDRVIAGVAAGVAAPLGVDPLWVRLGFGLAALAGGAGVVAYVLAWLVLPEVEEAPRRVDVAPNSQRTAGVVAVSLGVLVALRSFGVWFGDTLVWPLVLVALGAALVWDRSDARERARLSALARQLPGRPLEGVAALGGFLRIAGGGVVVLAGFAGLVAAGETGDPLRSLLLAGAAVLAGAALIVGPWLVGLRREADEERRRRIRSEERAEVAAHLHDSVLQTLTLIQRSDVPDEVVRLARSQERDLRTWLSGRDLQEVPTRLRGALEATAARVEDRLGVPVEVVVVGDADLDEPMMALVAATAEAATNAARHSGAAKVSLYAEAEAERIEVAVRDEGCGFDPDAVPPDRRGLTESIVGRLRRHDGTAVIDSVPGEGTEVVLVLPRSAT